MAKKMSADERRRMARDAKLGRTPEVFDLEEKIEELKAESSSLIDDLERINDLVEKATDYITSDDTSEVAGLERLRDTFNNIIEKLVTWRGKVDRIRRFTKRNVDPRLKVEVQLVLQFLDQIDRESLGMIHGGSGLELDRSRFKFEKKDVDIDTQLIDSAKDLNNEINDLIYYMQQNKTVFFNQS